MMKFWSHFAVKSYDNLKKGIAPAILVGIALLFAAQSPSTRAQDEGGQKDDDGHGATPITTCGFVISQPGRYFLANDLKQCQAQPHAQPPCPSPCPAISITVRDVRVELRGHTIQQTDISANAIDANGVHTELSNLEIEGPGTITGGSSGIYFGNVHRSRVHNLVMVGNLDGMDVNAGAFNPLDGSPDATTISTDNEISDNVITSNTNGISVDGGDHNRFINNNVSSNSFNGLLLIVANNNIARHNTADLNETNGIDIQASNSGNQLEDNIALGNAFGFDLIDENGVCPLPDTWTNNSFNSKSPDCIQ